MPKRNPYLVQYKENVSSQQRLIRQRLGQSVTDDNNDDGLAAAMRRANADAGPKLEKLQTSLRNLPATVDHREDFPSIDDENAKDVSQDDRYNTSTLERGSSSSNNNNKQMNRYSYFDHDAEESLQFFKKNLLPTTASQQQQQAPLTTTRPRPPPLSTPKQEEQTLPMLVSSHQKHQQPSTRPQSLATAASGGQYQKSTTGNLFSTDRQPSLSSSIKAGSGPSGGELASLAVAPRSRAAPLETSSAKTSRVTTRHHESTDLNGHSNYKYPSVDIMTTPKSMPTSIKQKIAPREHAPPRPPLPTSVQLTSRRPLSERQIQRPARPGSGELTRAAAADELELARAGLSTLALRKSTESPSVASRLPESPLPAEGFSRKASLNNSLLRAHDSIRLKVNRPKVRSSSSDDAKAAKPEDTELDDTIQLAEIARDGDTATPSSTNERAIDVKRRSSKKKSKSKKKDDVDDGGGGDNGDNQDKVPVRNFSEVRVVKIVRSEDERSLGVSVEVDSGNIVVARVFAGGLADKQGALQVGDIILAVNNREVYTPEQMQEQLRQSIIDDTVLLKIVPSFKEELPTLCIYLRALFDYDPNEDSLSPCKVKGVAFNRGDILEVINQDDNYWQARRVDSENLETGLIPSQELEERRRAFVIPDYDLATKFSMCGTKVSRKSEKKVFYNVGQNCDFDKADMQLYEEVCRTPAFERRTLVLIGANGVGKQALKARLINTDPERFGAPLPHTSRLPRDGEENGIHYHFVTRERMEEDIIAGKYLEYGEYDGALYGTKLDSVREIIGSSRICVLDCSPTCLKILKTSDYLPFVAFIAAPTLDQLRYMHEWNRGNNKTYATFDRALSRQSRRAKTLQDFAFDFFEDEDLQVTVEESARLFRMYENYFDIVLVNNDFDRTFEQLRDAIDALSQAPQWIPISWIYGT